jgi:hypothetical protein
MSYVILALRVKLARMKMEQICIHHRCKIYFETPP